MSDWIKTTEKQPNYNDKVFVTYVMNGDKPTVCLAERTHTDVNGEHYRLYDVNDVYKQALAPIKDPYDVIAWQEAPEPFIQ